MRPTNRTPRIPREVLKKGTHPRQILFSLKIEKQHPGIKLWYQRKSELEILCHNAKNRKCHEFFFFFVDMTYFNEMAFLFLQKLKCKHAFQSGWHT